MNILFYTPSFPCLHNVFSLFQSAISDIEGILGTTIQNADDVDESDQNESKQST